MHDLLQKLYQQHYSKEAIFLEGYLKTTIPMGPDFSCAYPKMSEFKQFSIDKPSQEQYMFAAQADEVDSSYGVSPSGSYKVCNIYKIDVNNLY